MNIERRFLSWGERFSGRVEVLTPPTIVVGSFNGMTLADWQASDPHIKAAQKLFRESFFRDALAVLSNARPVAQRTVVDHAFEHGRRVGYDEMLGLLLRLPRMPERPSQDVPTDYGALKNASDDTNVDDLDIH